MTAPVILVEASPRRAADGVAEVVRLAGGGAQVPFAYAGHNDWRAGITRLPTLIASLEFQGGEFPPGSVPAAAEIEWGPNSAAALAALASYMWFDAPISVWVGPEGAALPALALSGQVLEAPAADGKLRISLADPATSLRKPLLTTRFLGTGGLEGPVEWEGLIRPRIWGRVWNVSGQPIDKANNVYMFADPQRQIQAISAVRDKGAPAAALTTLAWQGSVAATFTALQAASAPAGGGVICPSIACVKWWTQPAGALCADLKGEIGAGYVETTAQIMQRLVQVIGGPAFAAGTIAAADAARAAPIGWAASDDATTVAAMLDELAGHSSLIWLLDASQTIVLRTWSWGASTAAAASQGVSRRKVLRPVATRKLGYQRNETRMQRGDLAAIVLASEARYNDGTPIEQLEPAEAGANVTGTHTAAAITGQGTGATANDLTGLNATDGAKLGGIAKGATAADNLLLNGDFTDGLTNWSGSAQVTVVAGAAGDPGRFKARVTGALGTFSTNANQAYNLPVYGGSRVWASGWIRSAGDPAQDYGYLGYYFIDRDNNYLGGGTDQLGTYYNNTSAWVFVIQSSIAPANAAGLVVSPVFVLASSTAAIVEITGIRAAYTAPGATLGASAGTDLYRADRTTVMTQVEVRTSEGIAAAISGQAAAATDGTIQPGATNDRIDATRTTDTDTPLWYATNRSGKVVREAKTQGYYFSAANVPNTGNYGTMTTAVPTLYASGGVIHQWFEADNATRWHRSSASDTTWTGWVQLFSDSNKPDFGGDLLETAGGASATLANFKTGLGTAAGFTGQGAFSTVSSVGYGSSFLTGFGAMAARAKVSLGDGFVFKADGSTSLTDAVAVTSLGTAAAFTGQGALAILGSVAYGSAYVTGFGAMAARVKVSLGDGFVFKADGSTSLTDTLAVTSLGTAAAITGQSALATYNPPAYASNAAALSAGLAVGKLFYNTTTTAYEAVTAAATSSAFAKGGVGSGTTTTSSSTPNTSCAVTFTNIPGAGYWTITGGWRVSTTANPFSSATSGAGTWTLTERVGAGAETTIASGTWAADYSSGAPGTSFDTGVTYNSKFTLPRTDGAASVNTGAVTVTLKIASTAGNSMTMTSISDFVSWLPQG